MFDQGEHAELTYEAFEIAAERLQSMEQEEIEVTFPVGYRANNTTISSTQKYKKDYLLKKYRFLAVQQLSVNTLIQLVTIVETMLGDVVRAVVFRYPQKLGSKRTLSIQTVLECASLEEVHICATDALLNELAYKSPSEFAESVQSLLSVNLLECPAFHRYMEVKATRDIFIHNRGVANDVYVRKAGSHARVKSGMHLPVDIKYFLESYESCLQVSDWLEVSLHSHWHSSEHEESKNPQPSLPLMTSLPSTEAALPASSDT